MQVSSSRECGDCALCCKLGEIPGFKPYNQWCADCSTHAKCDRYASRPQPCRDFFCYYLQSDLGPHWAPTECAMVVDVKQGPPLRMTILVDPESTRRWHEPLYLQQIMHWATQGAVTIMEGETVYAAYPDKVELLGELTPAHMLVITEIETAGGLRYLTALQPR